MSSTPESVDYGLIKCILEDTARNVRDLLIGNKVQVYREYICSLRFLREHVGVSKPLVIRNESFVRSWKALETWKDDDYLLSKLDGVPVTVALTPQGLADCPLDDGGGRGVFALPLYQKMEFKQFFDIITTSGENKSPVVAYLQQQNSSLVTELSTLLEDVSDTIPWAEEAFGHAPDAVNFWMGKYPTATSWHRDHYENLYVVVRGKKVIRLLPPIDSFRMEIKKYPQAEYILTDSSNISTLKLQEISDTEILWSSIKPCACLEDRSLGDVDCASCPSCKHLRRHGNMFPLEIEINAGDMLYIPSCWYHEIHHPRTEEPTIAINYWFDMIHDSKYAAMVAMDTLAEKLHLNEAM